MNPTQQSYPKSYIPYHICFVEIIVGLNYFSDKNHKNCKKNCTISTSEQVGRLTKCHSASRNFQALPPPHNGICIARSSWMLARKQSMVHQFFSAVIVTITTASALVGWPNINNVTCLLTPPIALQGSQYQETDEPLQGGRRCWKIPHCHHHNQFTHHCL